MKCGSVHCQLALLQVWLTAFFLGRLAAADKARCNSASALWFRFVGSRQSDTADLYISFTKSRQTGVEVRPWRRTLRAYQTRGWIMIADLHRVSVARVQELIEVWPQDTKAAAADLMERHGPPDEANDGVLVWNNPGRWSRVILHRDQSLPLLSDAALVALN